MLYLKYLLYVKFFLKIDKTPSNAKITAELSVGGAVEFDDDGKTKFAYNIGAKIVKIKMVADGYEDGTLPDHEIVKEEKGDENKKALILTPKKVSLMEYNSFYNR